LEKKETNAMLIVPIEVYVIIKLEFVHVLMVVGEKTALELLLLVDKDLIIMKF
jgi:hypothetical protein